MATISPEDLINFIGKDNFKKLIRELKPYYAAHTIKVEITNNFSSVKTDDPNFNYTKFYQIASNLDLI